MIIAIGHAPKTVKINESLYLHFFYANNKGRGSNNCTIVKSASPIRKSTSKEQFKEDTGIDLVQTSSWAGNVNFSSRVRRALELE